MRGFAGYKPAAEAGNAYVNAGGIICKRKTEIDRWDTYVPGVRNVFSGLYVQKIRSLHHANTGGIACIFRRFADICALLFVLFYYLKTFQ